MDRKSIGFGENGGESSSLMQNKPEQCSKQLTSLFFCLLVWLGALSLLHPYSIHHSLWLSLTISFSLSWQERWENQNNVWFGFWSANELIEPSESLSSLYLQTPLNNPPSPSIHPLISNRGNNVSTRSSHLRAPRWRQAATRLFELLFTEGRFDARCALISWRAQRARVSEAQN